MTAHAPPPPAKSRPRRSRFTATRRPSRCRGRNAALVFLGAAGVLFGASGCVTGYESALGYRARQAALARDVDRFEALMEEAAARLPSHPLDVPEKTVLTHFLDLADDPRFFVIVDGWMEHGYISEHMTCAIHRARYQHIVGRDPEDAAEAAGVCVDRAREAALAGDRSWEIDACFEDAPFLVETSTSALVSFLRIAADPTEPRAFRAGLLKGLTSIYIQDPAIRRMNDDALPAAVAHAQGELQVDRLAARLLYVVDAVRISTDPALLAGSTAFGALELERASHTLGRSFLADDVLARGGVENEDLAWAWVRTMKKRKADPRHEGLGLWNRKREPAGDAYWYGCSRTTVDEVFDVARVEVAAVRATERAEREAVLAKCGGEYPSVDGPYPLEATLRMALTSSVANSRSVGRVRVSVKKREVLPKR